MKKIPCPICKNDSNWDENPFRPFCSERCRLIDLGNWASEKYRIKSQEEEKKKEEE